MKIEYRYNSGEHAHCSLNDAKKLICQYKASEKLSDQELLELLDGVKLLEVCAAPFAGSTDLNWYGNMGGYGKAWMILNCDDEHKWVKLFINALPRLKQLLIESKARTRCEKGTKP